jgi:hypothetical protein
VHIRFSGLFLEGKKARVQALKPWSLLVETTFDGGMVRLYEVARTYFLENPGGA